MHTELLDSKLLKKVDHNCYKRPIATYNNKHTVCVCVCVCVCGVCVCVCVCVCVYTGLKPQLISASVTTITDCI